MISGENMSGTGSAMRVSIIIACLLAIPSLAFSAETGRSTGSRFQSQEPDSPRIERTESPISVTQEQSNPDKGPVLSIRANSYHGDHSATNRRINQSSRTIHKIIDNRQFLSQHSDPTNRRIRSVRWNIDRRCEVVEFEHSQAPIHETRGKPARQNIVAV